MSNTKPLRINLGAFDLIKGLGLIVLVFGHSLPRYDVEQLKFLLPVVAVLELFETGTNPMFFIVSGFSFREKTVRKMLEKSSSGLLKPYLYVVLFIAVLFPLNHYLCYRWWPGAWEETVRTVLAFLFGVPASGKMVFGYSLYENSVVWFLLALFIAQNLLNLVLKLKNKYLQFAGATCCVIVGYVLVCLNINYFCLPQGLMAVGYCYVGYLLKKYNLFVGGKYIKWAYAVMGAVTVWQIAFSEFNISHGIFKYGLLDYFASMCAGVLLMAMGIYVGRLEWKGLEWIKQIGVYTYWIICIHSVEMTCVRWYMLTEHFAERQSIAFVIEVCVKVLLFTLSVLVLKQIVKRNYRRKIKENGK